MPDHDNRHRSDRIGSLLSLVPALHAATGTEGRRPSDDDGVSASERHRRARSRREAAASPLMAALAQARMKREEPEPRSAEPETFAEHERELRALFASDARRRASAPAPAAAPEPQPKELADVGFPANVDAGRPVKGDTPEPPPAVAPAAAPPRVPARAADEEPPAIRPVYASASDPGDTHWRPLIDPVQVVRGVLRSGWIIAATTVCGAAMAAALALSTPKQYVALTELIVDPRQLRIVQNELTDGGLSAEAMLAVVENQVRVLRSGVVLGKVVDTLGLDRDPEFNGTRSGGPLSFLGNLRALISSSGDSGDPSLRRRTLAIEHLGEATDVVRGGKTFVVAVTARTEDAGKSALIVNTLTDVFLETYGSIQAGAAGRASDEISARLAELRSGVEDAERKVEAFKSENDIVDAQGRLITDDEIVKLNDQLSTARARTLELQARADSARTVTVDAALAGNLPEQTSSPVLTELRTQYSLLRQEADRIGTRLGPRHPERVAIDAQVDAARARVEQELRLVASSIQVELRRAVQLEQDLAARLAQLKARQAGLSGELVTLRELEREATAKRAVYEAFLLRAGETGQQRDLNTANVSVISKATPPLEPSGPSRSMMTLLGAFLGFGAGVGIGVARGVVGSLRADGAGERPEQPPRTPFPRAAARLLRRPEHADETTVSARSDAQDANRPEQTAALAEETDMHHARAPMGWTPNDNPMPADRYPAPQSLAPYPQGVQSSEPPRQWMHPAGPAAGYAPYPQAPAYPPAPSYPQGYAPAQGHPGMQPQAYGQPAAPQMPPQGAGYAPYPGHPQNWTGQAPAQNYPSQPMDPRAYPYAERPAWSHAQQAAMAEPVYPYGYPQPQPQAGGWPQSGWQQPAAPPPVRRDAPPAPQASSGGDGDKSAIEEIRDSLREFRVALRDLAESRGRRRFL
ncbi:GumC family protein [Aquibium microcysteis]|uniref:GumC family protein n=1 Tax=Aquibium microcysteis TaxID=675281 RepID=UPI00165CF8E7|nr:GumC family protein [Aquibium microcysteis]